MSPDGDRIKAASYDRTASELGLEDEDTIGASIADSGAAGG